VLVPLDTQWARCLLHSWTGYLARATWMRERLSSMLRECGLCLPQCRRIPTIVYCMIIDNAPLCVYLGTCHALGRSVATLAMTETIFSRSHGSLMRCIVTTLSNQTRGCLGIQEKFVYLANIVGLDLISPCQSCQNRCGRQKLYRVSVT
jgi:hypothetical protein